MSKEKFYLYNDLEYEELLDRINNDNSYITRKDNELGSSKHTTSTPINLPRIVVRSKKHHNTSKEFKKIQKKVFEKRKKSDSKHVSFKSDFEEIINIKSWKQYNSTSLGYKINIKQYQHDIQCGCIVF